MDKLDREIERLEEEMDRHTLALANDECPACLGEHNNPDGTFCRSCGDQFNEWYRMGVADWVAHRTKLGLVIGEAALWEWADNVFPKIVCASCDERKLADQNDYLCRECRNA